MKRATASLLVQLISSSSFSHISAGTKQFSKLDVARISSLLVLLCAAQLGFGQAQPGVLPFSTMDAHQYDSINLANLNIYVQVPVRKKPSFGLFLSGNSNLQIASKQWGGAFILGYYGGTNSLLAAQVAATGYVDAGTCPSGPNAGKGYTLYKKFSFVDRTGASHSFGGGIVDNYGCVYPGGSWTVNDGSGYTLVLGSNGSGTATWAIYDRSGSYSNGNVTPVVGLDCNSGCDTSAIATVFTDTNNNQSSLTFTNSPTDTTGYYTDPLSSTSPLKFDIGATTPGTWAYTWTDAHSANQTDKVVTGSYSLVTAFACTGITDESGSSPAPMPSSISLADGSSFTFGYERGGTSGYTGRLGSMTVPTGATISYAYSGGTNGINCQDGTANTLKRTTPDSATPWTYFTLRPRPAVQSLRPR